MSALPQHHIVPFTQFEQLREARDVLKQEADAILALSGRLDASFCDAVSLLQACAGSVIVTGMGKAGLIGQKIVATFSSLGTRAHFLHPAEAVHGDLGCLHASDVLLALSNSGETEELCRLIPILRSWNIPVIAVTAVATSTLGSQADVTIPLGRMREAGTIGLAPTTSTTAMLALGDALALVLCRLKGFTPEHFSRFHPGGSLGRQLTPVRDAMRMTDELRIARDTCTIREALVTSGHPSRRTGAVMVIDSAGRLSGLFTDSDLARLLEHRHDQQLDRPIAEVMTKEPLTIPSTATLADAVDILSQKKISELPVVDGKHRPIGLVDITDVLALMPADDSV